MSKLPKKGRPRAEAPKGFRDYFGDEVKQRKLMLDRIAEVYDMRGFDALETSAVETVEALGKFLPDVERPNAGVFAWQEEQVPGVSGGDWLALRYDLTAPLARVAAQYRNNLPMPYRRYAMGPVWRNEKPGLGRFRQFYQCDADTVGSASPAADAEIIAMLTDALEAAGIDRGDYVVRLNSRKVLNGVLEAAGVKDEQTDDVLRQIDKLDKVGPSGVRQLLTSGREDDSGSFISGAGLDERQTGMIINFLTASGGSNTETINNLHTAVGDSADGLEGVGELEQITTLLAAMGLGNDRIIVDPSVVRGLGYYTGAVFEAELTFEVVDAKGRKRQFGSVAGGGRYDGLVERFTGQKVPATGVSIGVDRLLAALRENEKVSTAAPGPVVITVMDRDRMADYQAMATELRSAGIRAEVYLGNPRNLGNQLKYADRRRSPAVIVQGENEAVRGTVMIKDLALGSRISQDASVEEWKAQPAQAEYPRRDLVAGVLEILKTEKSGD